MRSTDSWLVAAKAMFQNVAEFVETLKEEKCRLKDIGD